MYECNEMGQLLQPAPVGCQLARPTQKVLCRDLGTLLDLMNPSMLFGYARSWCHQNIHDISGVTTTTILPVLHGTLTLLQAGQKYSVAGDAFVRWLTTMMTTMRLFEAAKVMKHW
jgi:hypothetical protein